MKLRNISDERIVSRRIQHQTLCILDWSWFGKTNHYRA